MRRNKYGEWVNIDWIHKKKIIKNSSFKKLNNYRIPVMSFEQNDCSNNVNFPAGK